MGLRIPQNQIVQSKYTSGGEYIFENTYKEYQGYYYEANGKIFAGKEPTLNAPVLIPVSRDEVGSNFLNLLLTSAATYVYGKISKTKIPNTKVSSVIYNNEDNVRYFSYQITNKIIKEINKDTFDKLKLDPLYKTVQLTHNPGFSEQELNNAENNIPGIKTFVNTSYIPPQVEDDGTIG